MCIFHAQSVAKMILLTEHSLHRLLTPPQVFYLLLTLIGDNYPKVRVGILLHSAKKMPSFGLDFATVQKPEIKRWKRHSAAPFDLSADSVIRDSQHFDSSQI